MGARRRERKITGYTRRSAGGYGFGQEFDSPRLHHQKTKQKDSNPRGSSPFALAVMITFNLYKNIR